jgi:hypothetical protein
MTEEQKRVWFTYHPPADAATAAKYNLIDSFDSAGRENILQALTSGEEDKVVYETINTACVHLAAIIAQEAPNCADRAEAIRCVRLARGIYNQAARVRGRAAAWAHISSNPSFFSLVGAANIEMMKAAIQANAAIACNGI